MIYSVQYLRGFAALLVVMSHVFTKTSQLSGYKGEWFSIGPAGVDLFFIISGFIMCKATERKAISPTSFMLARVKRIIPLYWFLSLVALAIFLMRPDLVNSSGGTTTVLHSFTLFPTGEKLLIQNGWTLSFEFLFYLIFAASIAINSDNKIRNTIIVLCSLVCAGLLLEPNGAALGFLTSTLLLEFAMGMAAYLYLRKYSGHKLINAGLIIFGMIALCAFAEYGKTPYRALCFGLPMLCIFIGFVSFEADLKKASHKKTLWSFKVLGDSSYSLYLFHPFALSLSAVVIKVLHLQSNVAISTLILISAALVSGYMCYAWLEVPLNKLFKVGSPKVVSVA